MRPRYTKPALAELDSILTHIGERSEQGALRVKARIKTIINLLLAHPRIGVQTAKPKIRQINATPYPYLIFYEIGEGEIVIHAVRHGARAPSTMPGRKS